ncbi:VOC family protein [Photobacterium leiognathi]|uniref:VOC family protein n=1 Tax=Photobacterium leiognathi TaxID=553611 RepID=UPI00273992B8|nr:VOC family protein [Photobacterium leiognathi]
MTIKKLTRPVGINHISLEVGNIAEAIDFYGSLFEIQVEYEETLGIPGEELASIEMGDQFIALTLSGRKRKDIDRHFGLVVDDKQLLMDRVNELGIPLLPGPTFTFLDPWGNRVEIVSYQNVMFSKLPKIMQQMEMSDLAKNDNAVSKMQKKGYL